MKEFLDIYRAKLVVLTGVDIEHIQWMLDEIPKIECIAKRNRWIGFVQGWYWSMGFFTIDEMRGHVKKFLAS